MGTRSLTFVYDEQGNKIINLYRQYDGYPTGHGQELAEFLNNQKMYNGAGDLAALLVAHFKKEPMNFYLHPTDVEDCGQDYEYHIYSSGINISIKIMNCGWNVFGETQDDTYEPLFVGSLEEFTKYCASEKYGDIEDFNLLYLIISTIGLPSKDIIKNSSTKDIYFTFDYNSLRYFNKFIPNPFIDNMLSYLTEDNKKNILELIQFTTQHITFTMT